MIKSLKLKLALAFGAIFLVLAATTTVNLYYLNDVSVIQNKVVNLRVKTVNAGKDINNGINYSLAALRGYMILGADLDKAQAMRDQRQQAWTLIDNSMAVFDEVSVNWTVPKNIEILQELKTVLTDFKAAQKKVEDIAQTTANIPSYQVLLTEAAPRAAKILAALTGIIDLEAGQEASAERKALLTHLANSRGAFAIGLANIRAYLLSGNSQFKAEFEAKWQVNEENYQIIANKYAKLLSSEQQQHWKNYQEYRQQFSVIPEKMFALRSAADWNQANYILGSEAAPNAAKAVALLSQMQNSQNTLLANDVISLKEHSDAQVMILILGAAISLFLSIAIAIGFGRDLLGRLSPLLQKATEISNNNLSTPALVIKGNDELTQLSKAVNQMSEALTRTLTSTAESIQGVSSEANNIFIANTDMSKTIDKQNEQINLIAAAIEQLSASSKEVSDSSELTAKSAEDSLLTAKEGGNLMRSSMTQMSEISEAFDNSAASIGSLSEQSKKVEDILGVIRGIAEQTNLLALNAAIEAARAGEQGRGFAVVADEVRQLASRTTDATADVEKAIDQMRNDAGVSVKSMEIGREKVKHGIEISDKVSNVLDEIIKNATEVSSKMKSIATSSNEQSAVTAEIAANTNQVSILSIEVNKSISNVVDMTRAVSESSSHRAQELMKMVK
ncbi:MAG: methyl-accepting chemotaxis protein [Oceanospirillaceae bacterium]|nr:methyl-accepting chemotaxis protein [Oceanospirillaceae bacterium]